MHIISHKDKQAERKRKQKTKTLSLHQSNSTNPQSELQTYNDLQYTL